MNVYEDFDARLGAVIDSIKQLLYSRHEDIFERLDFEEDDIYLEPMLYTYVNQNDDKWLDSIIYGYETKRKAQISVFSNAEGVIYLPRIGYFKTPVLSACLSLHTGEGGITLSSDGLPVDYTFEPLLFLGNGMEVVKYQHPLLEVVFTEQVPEGTLIAIEGIYEPHLDSLRKGMEIIAENNPENFNILTRNVKKVMLFRAEKPNSFAVMKAHNMIFLNVNTWDTEVFFADHISHEGGHVIFNTLTYESKFEMFTCHHNTAFAEVTGEEREHSSVYLRFHAFFSYYEIMRCIRSCIEHGSLSEKNRREAEGRYVFHAHRFKLALESFEHLDVFKPVGLAWFDFFKAFSLSLQDKYHALEPRYVLNEQPYDFNSSIFEKQNPVSSVAQS
jgi:hypothetical protein